MSAKREAQSPIKPVTAATAAAAATTVPADPSKRPRHRPSWSKSHATAPLTLKDVANSNSTMHAFMGGKRKSWMTASPVSATPSSAGVHAGRCQPVVAANTANSSASIAAAPKSRSLFTPISTPTTSNAPAPLLTAAATATATNTTPTPPAPSSATAAQRPVEAEIQESVLPSPAPSEDVALTVTPEAPDTGDARMVDLPAGDDGPRDNSSDPPNDAPTVEAEQQRRSSTIPQTSPEMDRRPSQDDIDAVMAAAAGWAVGHPAVTSAQDAEVEMIWSRPRRASTQVDHVNAMSGHAAPMQNPPPPPRPPPPPSAQAVQPPIPNARTHPEQRASSGGVVASRIRIPPPAHRAPSRPSPVTAPPVTAPPIAASPVAASPVVATPQPSSRPTITLPSSFLPQIDAYVQLCGGTGALDPEVVSPRVELLRRACSFEDCFYLALHQLFCLETLQPGTVLALPGFGPAHRSALEVLAILIHPNQRMAKGHVMWFASFPSSWDTLLQVSALYQNSIAQVRDFLPALLSEWDRYSRECCSRDYPPLVSELAVVFKLKSVTLQYVIFTAIHRRMMGDLPAATFKHYADVFLQDQTHYFQAMSRIDAARPLGISLTQPATQGIIAKYRHIRQAHLSVATDVMFARSLLRHAASQPAVRRSSTDLQSGGSYVAAPGAQASPNPAGATMPANFTHPSALANRRVAPPMTVMVPGHSHSYGPGAPPRPSLSGSPRKQMQALLRAHQQSPSTPAQPGGQPTPRQVRSTHLLPSTPQYPPVGTSTTVPAPAPATVPNPTSTATTPALRYRQANLAPSPQTQGHPPGAWPGGQPQYVVEPSQYRHGQRTPQLHVAPSASPAVQPGPRPLVPSQPVPAEVNHPPNPSLTALHQTSLSSPRLISRQGPSGDGSPERLYRYVKEFAGKPYVLPPDPAVLTLRFLVSQQYKQLLPERDETRSAASSSAALFVRERSIMYRLRCCTVDPVTRSCDEASWAIKDTVWPEHVFVEVNGSAMDVRRKFHHGKDMDLGISGEIQEGENLIRIAMLRTERERNVAYAIAVEVVEFSTQATLVQACLQADPFPAEQTLGQIQASMASDPADDDELSIVDSQLTVSVTDPFMARMFEVPVRSISCRHRDCFDLATFIATRKSGHGPKSTTAAAGGADRQQQQDPNAPCSVDGWKCPLCGVDARPTKLRVDEFLQRVRKQLARQGLTDVKAIVVRQDGSWAPKVPANTTPARRQQQQQQQPAQQQQPQQPAGGNVLAHDGPDVVDSVPTAKKKTPGRDTGVGRDCLDVCSPTKTADHHHHNHHQQQQQQQQQQQKQQQQKQHEPLFVPRYTEEPLTVIELDDLY